MISLLCQCLLQRRLPQFSVTIHKVDNTPLKRIRRTRSARILGNLLEAIAIKLEAIASRLEAIASRLKAIAIRLGVILYLGFACLGQASSLKVVGLALRKASRDTPVFSSHEF